MSVHVQRVKTIAAGAKIRVTVDAEGNSVVWMLDNLITDEGAELLGQALAANRVYYKRLDIPRQLTPPAA